MEKKKGSLKSTITVSLTNYLDAGAIVAGASGLTLWQDYLGLSEGHLGWLNFVSANCLGAAIGAIIGGFLADKYGRKLIYTYNMLIYMLGVAIVIFAVNFPMLLAGFLVTGISVGIGVPASWTYISESSEINKRGRNICISQMAWGIGPTIILFLGMLFAPATAGKESGALFGLIESCVNALSGGSITGAALNVYSSRVVFGSLFVVALIAWLLQRRLDESAEWTAMKAGETTQEKSAGVFSSFGTLFSNKKVVKTLAFLACMYLSWNLVASVMGFFQPHIYETAGGLSNSQANMLASGQWLIIIAFTFLLSFVIDRINQRWVFAVGVVIGICAWFIIDFIGITDMKYLVLFTVLWGLHSGLGVQTFYALWATELFPAKYRAAAQGVMFFFVRGLSAVWGVVFAYIYGANGQGFGLAAAIMTGLLIVSLLIGVICAPETRGKTLDQITKERYGENI
ncbi:MAG: MFS transporter [Bacteroidales bacterium]|nr:MFS transporter [Bacteroidales bacterium]